MKRRFFTLLELLIVVAIIAILAGMLLPALNSARNKATMIQCVSNMKTMGMGVHQYVNMFNDMLPYAEWESVHNPKNRIWYQLINSYVINDYKIFRCPGDYDPVEFLDNDEYRIKQGNTTVRPTYIGYAVCVNNAGVNYTSVSVKCPKMSRIKEPTKSVYLTDMRGKLYVFLAGEFKLADYLARVTKMFHHGGKGSLLMIDGHVATENFPKSDKWLERYKWKDPTK